MTRPPEFNHGCYGNRTGGTILSISARCFSSHGGSGVCGNAGNPFASRRMISGATAEQSPCPSQRDQSSASFRAPCSAV